MSRSLTARYPVGKHLHEVVAATSGTHITTAAWVEVISSLAAPISGLMILNTTGKLIKMSVGAIGEEDENEVRFYIMPAAEPQVLAFDGIKKGARISLRAVDADATDDSQIVFNLFG